MGRTLRVAAATVNQTPLDWEGNEARIKKLLQQSRHNDVGLVVFPELCVTSYNCEDMFFSLHTVRMAEMMVSNLLPDTKGLACVFGLPIFHEGAMYNCALVVENGVPLGLNPKKQLPREGVHYESRWFKPGRYGQSETTAFLGEDIPFGDYRYQFSSYGMAIEICEEAWRSRLSAADHASAGVEVVVNPSASHFALGKYKVRETMVANNSRSMQVHYIHTNLLGVEAGRMIYDGGAIFSECGVISKRGMRFGFHDGSLTIKDLDLDKARVAKLRNRSEKAAPKAAHGSVIRGHYSFSEAKKKAIKDTDRIYAQARADQWDLSKEEEFLAALMLGLFDYLRKCRARGFMLSMSGGCDSGAIAIIVAHTIASALKELGPNELGNRLNLKPSTNPDEPRSWIKEILTTVYQSTDNSGPVTRTAAREVAYEIGAEHHEVDVQDAVNTYLGLASSVVNRQLEWAKDDLALQNIQARSRAPMVWLLANIKGALLLATSNRSEVALGYATMDGDTAGGFAPLGGIDKDYLRKWLRWAEKDCQWGLGPLAKLSLINAQAPTAELRPKDKEQQDESDLMPYEILGRIEKCFVKDLMEPQAILNTLAVEYPAISTKQLGEYVKRFLKLWSQNQWKRERYAPSFLLDDNSLDPKTWCRFPILSSGFQHEINNLFTDI